MEHERQERQREIHRDTERDRETGRDRDRDRLCSEGLELGRVRPLTGAKTKAGAFQV